MAKKIRIGFIGAGKMAEALIIAIIRAKLNYKIIASDKNEERLDYIKKETGIKVSLDNSEIIGSDIIIIAVKPQVVDGVLEELKDCDKLVVSIAAGITLKRLESKLANARVIRVMPNTPCLVGEMAAGYSLGNKVTQEDAKVIERILNSAGIAYKLDERLLDAVTALSGSGPAFIAYIIDIMIEAAVKEGLTKEVATSLALQTCKGSAMLMLEKKLLPTQLIEMVSSPNGTTVRGLEAMKDPKLKEIIGSTIAAAAKRSRELGK